MEQLIPITTQQLDDSTVQAVDARELHAFLEVGKDFTNWIKGRIGEYGFAEGRDYVVFGSPILANQKGRGGDRRSKDYALTLDMAKELAMVERNEKGRQARRYFIEAEKSWRSQQLQPTSSGMPYTVREVILRPDGQWGPIWAIPVYRIDGLDYWNVHLVLEAYCGLHQVPEHVEPQRYAFDLMRLHPELMGAAPLWVARTENLRWIVYAARGCMDKKAREFIDLLASHVDEKTQRLRQSGQALSRQLIRGTVRGGIDYPDRNHRPVRRAGICR